MERASAASSASLSTDRHGAARAFSLFLYAAAVFVGITVLIPGAAGATRATQLGAAGVAVLMAVIATGCWRWASRIPVTVWNAAPFLGVVFAAGLHLLTSDASAGAQLFFLWPVLYAATLLKRPLVIAVLVIVSAAECVVVFTLKPASSATVDAAGLITALVMASVIILRLRARVGRLLTELQRQALADPLTGLSNRRAFELALRDEVAQAVAGKSPLSMLAIDLDRFKQVNDTWGHAAGDEVLRTVADAMRTAARQDDVVARLGGDEFAVIVRGDSAAAARVAERIRRTLAAAADTPGGAPTLSIGYATVPDHASDVSSLSAAADAALYEAKARGRDRAEAPRQRASA